jgi:hypothetical protein
MSDIDEVSDGDKSMACGDDIDNFVQDQLAVEEEEFQKEMEEGKKPEEQEEEEEDESKESEGYEMEEDDEDDDDDEVEDNEPDDSSGDFDQSEEQSGGKVDEDDMELEVPSPTKRQKKNTKGFKLEPTITMREQYDGSMVEEISLLHDYDPDQGPNPASGEAKEPDHEKRKIKRSYAAVGLNHGLSRDVTSLVSVTAKSPFVRQYLVQEMSAQWKPSASFQVNEQVLA